MTVWPDRRPKRTGTDDPVPGPGGRHDQCPSVQRRGDRAGLADGAGRIERKLSFGDFAATLAFVNRVGELAEAEGHHPDISFGWGYCDITLYTHKIGGLHENDFIMAAKINGLD